jgi:AraC-like DNA-binding protein
MQKLYTLDFHLADAAMCLITLDVAYDQASREMPYYRHRHNAFEIHFITSGSCTIRAGEENYRLKEQDLFLLAPGVFHSVKNASDDYDRICLIFETGSLPKDRLDQETLELVRAIQSEKVLKFHQDSMAQTLRTIKETVMKGDRQIGGKAKLQTLMELLLIDLAEHMDTRETLTSDGISSLDKQRGFLIDEFFHGNFYISDGDRMLSDILCISSRQLDRVLKKLYGKGFREKLLEVRLEVAKDFLCTTDKSIVEISELMGYGSPANFGTFIRKMTGKTPSSIRKTKDTPAFRTV